MQYIKTLVFVSFCCLFAVNVVVYPQTPDRKVFKERSKQYFQLIQTEDFNSVAGLFHYPADYSDGERVKDISDIRRVQKILYETFGKPRNLQMVERSASAQIYNFGVGGADPAYWEAHPEYDTIEYAVSFEQTGRGHIQIHYCNIAGSWEIRSILYDLPQSTAVARAAMSSFTTKMKKLSEAASTDKK